MTIPRHDDFPSTAARLRFAIYLSSTPGNLTYRERFKLAARAGFEGVEMPGPVGQEEAEHIRDAALDAGLTVHSVSDPQHFEFLLTSSDPARVARGIRSVLNTIENARRVGADGILLVPGLVNKDASHMDSYRRSQAVIAKEILPAARECGIVIGIENVWNGALLSPVEYARYIDEFQSPFVRAYLDVGNIPFGYAADWIRIMGRRIFKLHIKDFRLRFGGGMLRSASSGRFSFDRIGKGAIDWDDVRLALGEIGYDGWATAAELWHGPVTRGLNRSAAMLCRNGVGHAPLLGPALFSLQKAMTLPSLRDASARMERFLR